MRLFILLMTLSSIAVADTSTGLIMGYAIGTSGCKDYEYEQDIKALKEENARLKNELQGMANNLGRSGFIYVTPQQGGPCTHLKDKPYRDCVRQHRGY